MALQFEKWEGTGNDFVLVDGRQAGRLPSQWSNEEVQALCDRERGVGSDGVVIVSMREDGVLDVDFRNPDGSRSFCGNGTRSALAWAHDMGLVELEVDIHAMDGAHAGVVNPDGTPGISLNVSSLPQVKPPVLPGSSHAAFLDTGSPHHVEWVEETEGLRDMDLPTVAAPARHHEDYAPHGCNVNVVVADDKALSIRTFERGVEAETLSCGTGVVAAALLDMARLDASAGQHRRLVRARGGTLEVKATRQEDGSFGDVWLFGAARRVFRGTWALAIALLALWSNPSMASELADGRCPGFRADGQSRFRPVRRVWPHGHSPPRSFDASGLGVQLRHVCGRRRILRAVCPRPNGLPPWR